jgi:hypothetical protein
MYPHRTTDQFEDAVFGLTRRAPLALLAGLVAVHLALKAVFFSQAFLYKVALPVEAATTGLVTPATLAGSIQLFVVVILGTVFLGGFSWQQIGLRCGGQRVVLTLLALMACTACLVCLALGGSLLFDAVTLRATVASLLQAIVGSALTEELFYRGFLLIQVYLLIRHALRAWSTSTCLVWSLAIVQLYFAVNHVPAAVRAGLPLEEMLLWLVQTALVGAMFSVLFIQTRSIILSVGAHGLINLSLPFLVSPVDPALVVLLLVCTAMLAGPWLFERDLQGAKMSAGSVS